MSALPKVVEIYRKLQYFIIMVNINDFEQFTSGRVKLLLVKPNRKRGHS